MTFKGSYTLRSIPPELWRETKIAAVKAGMTVREYILQAIEEKNEREGKDDEDGQYESGG